MLGVIKTWRLLLLGAAVLAILSIGSHNSEASATYVAPGVNKNGELDWCVVASPNQDTDNNSLADVAAISSDNVWAVGRFVDTSTGHNQAIIQHWDGTSWSLVPIPDAGPYGHGLNGIAAVSATDIWAVGYRYTSMEGYAATLIEHWDGTAWGVVPSPTFAGHLNYLYDVAVVGPNDVWAVGNSRNGGVYLTLILHWNGSEWSIVESPEDETRNYLYGIEVVAANDIWAVGQTWSGSGWMETLILHWDGTAWSLAQSPEVYGSDNALYDVEAVSANDVWAVGELEEGRTDPLIEHWDGTKWSHVSIPNTIDYYYELHGLHAISANDIWAVGYAGFITETRGLVMRWDGSRWNEVEGPDVEPIFSQLGDLVALSANEIWAVGSSKETSGGPSRTLTVLRSSACLGIPSPTPTSTATATSTPHVGMFEDVPPPHTFYAAIECMGAQGVISGYVCGGAGEPCIPPANKPYFRPGNYVSRGQLAKIVAQAANYQEPVSGQTFEDVGPGSTFYTHTERLVLHEVMNGYPCGGAGEPCVAPDNRPYFRPNASVMRGQATKIVANVAGYQEPVSEQTFEDVPAGSTFYDYVGRLASRKIMQGYPCGSPEPCVPPGNRPYFHPGNTVTRGQSSKIVANTFFPNCQAP